MFRRFPCIFALFAACVLALPASAADGPSVGGEPVRVQKEAAPPRLRLTAKAVAPHVTLPAVAAAELARIRNENQRAQSLRENGRASFKRIAVGLARDASIASGAPLQWIAVEGGTAARISIASPQAASMRLALDLAHVAGDVEMVFFGSADETRLFGPVRVADIANRTAPWWSLLTEGDTQTIEFFIPRAHADGETDPRVVAASHLFTAPSSGMAKRVQDIGDAGTCEVDVACSPLMSSGAFQNMRNAVAQMVFNDSQYVYLCTGTLLNDADTSTQIPWFYSANHCFDSDTSARTPSQMQSVADTLTTLWFFEASSCNSKQAVVYWVQRSGGATYVYNDRQSDVLFVRLRDTPPPGAYFAGWDASSPSLGGAMVDVHHPQGDLKKVSQGSVLDFTNWDSTSTPNQYTEVRYASGSTEGGSSGSGLFTFNGTDYVLRGGLRGGTALCSNQGGTDLFSRLDLAYGALSPYLGGTSKVATPFANFTDLWWNPNESGWGLNIIQHADNKIFAVWYTYDTDGNKAWYVMPDGAWTSSTTYGGALYSVTGPPATAGFDPNAVKRTVAGTASLTFTDANNGTWSFNLDGLSGTKTLSRQPF